MKAVRIGLCALIAFAVLSFGAVELWTQTILEIGAAVLFAIWGIVAARKRCLQIHWNWLYLPMVGLGVLAAAQYALGLSVYPYLTKVELLRGGAYFLFFFLAVQSFRTVGQVKPLVWLLLSFGFLLSLFGIIQHSTFNGRLYWTVPLPSGGTPFGPYVNRNDFAGFVLLTAPLGLSLLFFRAARREHFTLLLLFTIVPVGAVIVSASRAGIVGLIFELALLYFLSRTAQVRRKQLLSTTAVAAAVAAFILWLGAGAMVQRFRQMTPAEISGELRIPLYRDTWRIFRDHVLFGTGLGTLAVIYPQYASFYDDGLVVDHAHNDYLELLADAGLAGGFCGLCFILLVLWQGVQRLRSSETRLARALSAGPFIGCCGLLLQSLVDFSLHIPSNVLLFLLLLSAATLPPEPAPD